MPTDKHLEEWTWDEIYTHAIAKLASRLQDGDPRLAEWLDSRPPEIRELVKSHPDHLIYRVKPGAPYSGTHPGAIGAVMSYSENPEGALGEFAIKFGMLRAADGRQYIPIFAHVGAEWLESVPMEELEHNAKLETN